MHLQKMCLKLVLVPCKGQNPGDAAEENSSYHSCGWGACHNPSFLLVSPKSGHSLTL